MRWLLLTVLVLAPCAQAVQVDVFRDNPIVALQDPGFRDNALSLHDPAFEGALMQVELGGARLMAPADRPLDAYSPLSWGNQRIVIADGSGVPDGSVTRRDDPRFLETMVFVYVDRALQQLETLGYNLTAEGPIYAYAHDPPAFRAWGTPTPSMYPDAYVPSREHMHFMYRAPSIGGQGGMGSSAEDGEIILHELGHIIHVRMAPQVRYTEDWYGRWAEGTGDILAALLAEDYSGGYGDACLMEWIVPYYPDTLPTFQSEDLDCIRVLDGDFTWPDDEFGQAHRDGQFWTQAVWEVRQEIGRNDTLRLLLESMTLLPEEITSFEDIGHALMLADAMLFNGSHEAMIRDAFTARGITVSSLQELNPQGPEGLPPPLAPVSSAPPTTAMAPPADSNEARTVASGLVLVVLVAGLCVMRRSTS